MICSGLAYLWSGGEKLCARASFVQTRHVLQEQRKTQRDEVNRDLHEGAQV